MFGGAGAVAQSMRSALSNRVTGVHMEMSSFYVPPAFKRYDERALCELFYHSARVAALCRHIVLEEGVSENIAWGYYDAGIYHDIGKLFINGSILSSRERLSPEQMMIVKKHCQRGHRYAVRSTPEGSSLSQAHVLNAILYHHERWDGTGYPFGIRGNEIPLEAQLMSLVDNLEALSGDRCYRKPWPWARIVEYVTSQAGSCWSHDIIELFLRHQNFIQSALVNAG